MKSVMAHSFSQVPKVQIQRSSFDRSHGYKTAFDAGFLVPFFVDEALPGDTFQMNATTFARLATPIKPLMDNLFMDTFYFAVPHRLIWDNWQKFCGEQVNPGDSIDFLIPISAATGGYAVSSLQDYMGIPPGIPGIEHSVLPLRAYNLIWNEWFRDENLQNSIVVNKGNGPDAIADYTLKRRGKRHDYFTSCLPWPQKGNAVSLPLGTTATVKTNATNLLTGAQPVLKTLFTSGGVPTSNVALTSNAGDVGVSPVVATFVTGVYPSNLYADLATATAATINQLRQSFQIQKLLERDARGGTRYVEIVRSHFGVISPDARLQRSEYLGGGSQMVSINQISQQSATNAQPTPQGNMSAFGTVSGSNGFTKSFTEHCVIIGLVSVRADLTYQQGLNKMWSRSTRYDFFWPALAQIGEQAVLTKEIWSNGVDAADNVVFGYQERYAEYRYKPSMITGLMRSDAAGTLDVWHLSQDFAAAPILNAAFIEENPPIARVVAVPSEKHFIFDSYIQMRCARPMPLYGVPGLIDHF